MQIAPAQRERIDTLRETLDGLKKAVGRENREDFREMEERLNAWAARIAVIGQVKAGKSTFLNAFLHHHDFLPNDVNPWTSVVTNIRANVVGDPKTGARFDFFGEDDWDEIINGSNRIRKMAEQLLPGFDGAVLREQSAELRDRAQAKLGKYYDKLLGSKHEYEFVTPDLLKRYVCAGAETDEPTVLNGPRDPSGKYASLTREANVFMSLPEFQVPAIITDTPGVNDPFLVRDEVTCRSLDRSDVFVVVLSAHQALTDVDIGLIRILVQQDSKDVLIFVNRIDELDDYDTRYEQVLEDVSNRLSDAIPDITFDILPGSAFMADTVFRSDSEAEELRAALDDETLARYLQTRYGYVPDNRTDRLLLGSGFEDIKKTLSTIIDTGEGARQLERIKASINTKVAAVQFETRREQRSVLGVLNGLSSNEPQRVTDTLEAEISSIGEAAQDIDRYFDTARNDIEVSVQLAWSSLETALNMMVEAFVETQKANLEEHVVNLQMHTGGNQGFEIDMTPIHEQLESAVSNGFKQARHTIDVKLENVMVACCAKVAEKLKEDFDVLSLEDLPFDSFSSTLAMSKKTIAINLVTERGWAFWRRRNVDVARTVETMKVMAQAEMRPAIEKLVGAFNEAQSERASAGLERVAVLQKMMETSLDERSRRLKSEQNNMAEATHTDARRSQVLRRLQSQIEVLERRMQQLSVYENQLTVAGLAKAA